MSGACSLFSVSPPFPPPPQCSPPSLNSADGRGRRGRDGGAHEDGALTVDCNRNEDTLPGRQPRNGDGHHTDACAAAKRSRH